MTSAERKRITDRRANRVKRARARAKGRCGSCTVRRPEPGRSTCLHCIARAARSLRDRRARWAAEGRCTNCGRARDAERKLCARCRQRALRYALGLCQGCGGALVGDGARCADCTSAGEQRTEAVA